MLMILYANAVAHPGTMMVEAHHTLLADGAVVRPRWLHYLTLGAVLVPQEVV
jgi:hypothetical protein